MSLDLRTGLPIWLIIDPSDPKHTILRNNIITEVVVIGAGISGALIADELIARGIEVVMVDSREVAAGSTSASTAILSYETDTNLVDLIKDIGEEQAVRVWRAGIEAIDHIAGRVANINGDCGFSRRDSLYYASKPGDEKKIKAEFEKRKQEGFDVDYLTEEALFQQYAIKAPGAIISHNIAEIDPVQFTRCLISDSEKKGLVVYCQTKIVDYNNNGKQIVLTTENGSSITANSVVYASGYESQQLLQQKKVKLNSSYAIASEPIDNLPQRFRRVTIWESARPYLYIRTTHDNRLIVGGEDVEFENEEKRDALLASKGKKLEQKINEILPNIPFTRTTTWTGTFAESDDALPYIGTNKKFPGAYFALGYGGNGTTFAAMASGIIPDMIQGKPNSDANLFRFDR